MKKELIKKCNLNFFDLREESFWMDNLENLLVNYPSLESDMNWEMYCLIYVEKGDGTIVIDDVSIRIDEPKIILIKPNQVTVFDIARRTKGFIICFKEDFFNLRYNNNVLYAFSFIKQGAKSFQRINDRQSFKVKSILEFMSDEYRSETQFRAKILRSYLNILLFDIQKAYSVRDADDVIAFVHEKIIAFEKQLNKHYSESRLPSFYAKKLHISENYLNRLCKQYKGKTAGDMIRERVSIEAQRLLLHTQMSVAEISHRLGFESASYFATFFKKQFDSSPEEFRQRLKK